NIHKRGMSLLLFVLASDDCELIVAISDSHDKAHGKLWITSPTYNLRGKASLCNRTLTPSRSQQTVSKYQSAQ
ncbi:hypothetical protein EDB19DRAFT_1727160, partial [Suillus lakei]